MKDQQWRELWRIRTNCPAFYLYDTHIIRPWQNEEQKVDKKEKKTTLPKDGSSALLNIALEREGKKKRKKKLLQYGVLVFGHPSKYYLRRTGLNFVEQTKHVAVLVVYGERLFLNSQMRKGIKKRKNI